MTRPDSRPVFASAIVQSAARRLAFVLPACLALVLFLWLVID